MPSYPSGMSSSPESPRINVYSPAMSGNLLLNNEPRGLSRHYHHLLITDTSSFPALRLRLLSFPRSQPTTLLRSTTPITSSSRPPPSRADIGSATFPSRIKTEIRVPEQERHSSIHHRQLRLDRVAREDSSSSVSRTFLIPPSLEESDAILSTV